jgi:hypothetical protein
MELESINIRVKFYMEMCSPHAYKANQQFKMPFANYFSSIAYTKPISQLSSKVLNY